MTEIIDTGYRCKIILQYDGTNFAGWQFQHGVRTVQSEIESALFEIFGQLIRVNGAGRTDSGVHALGQTADFMLPHSRHSPETIKKALNGKMNKDVRVLSAEQVDFNFHSRFNAKERTYRYRLLKQENPLKRLYAWYPKYEIDSALVQEVIGMLVGRHCFKAFCRVTEDKRNHLSIVSSVKWEEAEDEILFEITANRYLHQMVRGIVGALVEVGAKRISRDEFEGYLTKPTEKPLVYFAPPQGLVFLRVDY